MTSVSTTSQAQPRGAVGGRLHQAALRLQQLLQRAADPHVVVDDQDAQALQPRIIRRLVAPAQVDHTRRPDVFHRLVVLRLHHLAQPLEDLRDAADLAAHGVEALCFDGAVAVAGEGFDLALEQVHLVEDHGERVVDLVGEADGHLAQRRELVLAQDAAQVLGEADRAVLLAPLVGEQCPRDGDGDALARLGAEGGLKRLHDPGASVTGTAHRGHDPLGLVDVGVDLGHELAEDLPRPVAQDAGGTVVVVHHHALAVGGHNDVCRARDQLLEPFLRERHRSKA
jgi:hypothetical protein